MSSLVEAHRQYQLAAELRLRARSMPVLSFQAEIENAYLVEEHYRDGLTRELLEARQAVWGEREIRAMLRGATAARVIGSWNGEGPFGSCQHFRVFPRGAGGGERKDLVQVSEYCDMLRESGVEPLYRDSEPIIP